MVDRLRGGFRDLIRQKTSVLESSGNGEKPFLTDAVADYVTNELKGHVSVFFQDPDTEKILQDPTKPVILVANHPPSSPLAILPALAGRENVYMYGGAIFAEFVGPQIGEHILPVYRPQKTPTHSPFELGLRAIHPLNLSQKEADYKNSQTARRSLRIMRNGGLVIILPTGGIQKNWQEGIGAIVKALGKKSEKSARGENAQQAYYVTAYIEGTSVLDALRLISPSTRRVVGDFKPKVTFSPAQIIDTSYPDMDKEAVTHMLQRHYDDWVKALKS